MTGDAAVETEPETTATDQPAPEAGGEPAGAEPESPQLNDAIQQMSQHMETLLQRTAPEQPDPLAQLTGTAPEPDLDDEPYERPDRQAQPGEQPSGDEELEGALREMIREEAQQLVGPVFARQEAERRVAEIKALAEEYPRLKEPEVAGEISEELREMAQLYQNPHLQTDPKLIRLAYQAFEARAAARDEAPAEAGSRGAVLEQGAGPGPPEPEDDPIAQQYDQVFAQPQGRDAFTS